MRSVAIHSNKRVPLWSFIIYYLWRLVIPLLLTPALSSRRGSIESVPPPSPAGWREETGRRLLTPTTGSPRTLGPKRSSRTKPMFTPTAWQKPISRALTPRSRWRRIKSGYLPRRRLGCSRCHRSRESLDLKTVFCKPVIPSVCLLFNPSLAWQAVGHLQTNNNVSL